MIFNITPDNRQFCSRALNEYKDWRFYFLRVFGARCDNALAAATFAVFELFGLFRTDEAAFAARALVFRWPTIGMLLFCWPRPSRWLRVFVFNLSI